MGRPKRIEDEELLKIARAVFVLDGAHGSTREIAQRAGISEAALFKRYPTKVALFLAAMMPPNVDVDALIAVAEAISDPRQSLIVLCERMLDYFREAIPIILQLTQNPLIDLGGRAPPASASPEGSGWRAPCRPTWRARPSAAASSARTPAAPRCC